MFHNTYRLAENQEYQQMLVQQSREMKQLEDARQLEMYRQHNAQPQRIEVQPHKVGLT